MNDILTNLEAEYTVLGGCIADITNNSVENAHTVSTLPDDMFSTANTRTMHQAVKNLVAKGRGIDGVAFAAEVEHIEPAAMADYAQLITHGFGVINSSLIILAECRKRRIVRQQAEKMMRFASDPTTDIDALSTESINALRESDISGETKTIGSGLVEWYAELENAAKDKKRCMTGLQGLDDITGGIRGGKLVILGARPGVGKTALAISMGIHVATKSAPVLFVSLEMDSNEIISRIMAARTGVDVQRMESGKLEQDDWMAITAQAGEISNVPFVISTNDRTPNAIRRTAMRMKYGGGLGMVVVDYIQLLKPDTKTNNQYEAISSISRELKILAMDLGVPVLALTQFNRSSEGGTMGTKKRAPTMAEAKDSGSIEQDANLFLILYPIPEPDTEGTKEWNGYHELVMKGWQPHQLIVAKNRQGRTGDIWIGFDKAHMKFTTFRNDV